MAIYNRWGRIEIVAHCGKHFSKFHQTELDLLKVKWNDSLETEKVFYCFAQFLKSDNGWDEVRDAMYKAREVKLPSEEFKQAMIRAR